MKEMTKSAKTVEEAVDAAASELNMTKADVTVQIVEEPKKGFMGLGSKPAVVQVTANTDPIETGRAFLQSVTEEMGIPADIAVDRSADPVVFELSVQKAAIVIGKHGKTLNALQYLTNLAANRHSENQVSILLDAQNYRAKREDTLKQLAVHLCDKVEKTGREVKLEPMPSMERKVVHTALKDKENIRTYSAGGDPYRCVVIAPATYH